MAVAHSPVKWVFSNCSTIKTVWTWTQMLSHSTQTQSYRQKISPKARTLLRADSIQIPQDLAQVGHLRSPPKSKLFGTVEWHLFTSVLQTCLCGTVFKLLKLRRFSGWKCCCSKLFGMNSNLFALGKRSSGQSRIGLNICIRTIWIIHRKFRILTKNMALFLPTEESHFASVVY